MSVCLSRRAQGFRRFDTRYDLRLTTVVPSAADTSLCLRDAANVKAPPTASKTTKSASYISLHTPPPPIITFCPRAQNTPPSPQKRDPPVRRYLAAAASRGCNGSGLLLCRARYGRNVRHLPAVRGASRGDGLETALRRPRRQLGRRQDSDTTPGAGG